MGGAISKIGTAAGVADLVATNEGGTLNDANLAAQIVANGASATAAAFGGLIL
jgi:hypothetical protein